MPTIKDLRITAKERGFKVTGRKTSKEGKMYQEFLPRALIENMLATGIQAVPPPEWSHPTAVGASTQRPNPRPKRVPKKRATKTALAARKKLIKLQPGYETLGQGRNAKRDLDAHFAVQLASGETVNARNVANHLKRREKRTRSLYPNKFPTNVDMFIPGLPGRNDLVHSHSYIPYEDTYLTPLNVDAIHTRTGRHAIPGKRQDLYWNSRAYATKRKLRRAGITPLADGLGSSLYPNSLEDIHDAVYNHKWQMDKNAGLGYTERWERDRIRRGAYNLH